MKRLAMVLAGLVLVLGGCSQGEESPTPEPPQAPSTFESTAKLTEAMAQAGYPCQSPTTKGLEVSCGESLHFIVGDPAPDVCTPLEGTYETYGVALDPDLNKYNFDTVEERKAEYARFVGQPVILGQNWVMYPEFDWWTTGEQILWPADFDAAAVATALGGTQTTLGALCQWPATLEEAQR